MTKINDIFILPKDRLSVTGGNIYNTLLLKALKRRRFPYRITNLEKPFPSAGRYWVDSLYFKEVPEIARNIPQNSQLFIIVHYFPSMMHDARKYGKIEARAFACAHGFLVTSEFTRRELIKRKIGKPTIKVEPAPTIRATLCTNRSRDFKGLIVANLVKEKGVLEFLQELAKVIPADKRFNITVVGRTDMDKKYAEQCQQFVSKTSSLKNSVHFTGCLKNLKLSRAYQAHSFFISSSLMETFGIALRDARAAGQYLLVLDRGNAAEHVTMGAGEKFGIIQHLAKRVAHLVGNDAARAVAQDKTNAKPVTYNWDDAASEFLRQVKELV